MLSVNNRAIIVLIFVLVAVLLFTRDFIAGKKFSEKCASFMHITVIGFPLIDLKMVPSELNIKVFEILIFLFFMYNYKTLSNTIKKYNTTLVKILFFVLLLTGILSDYFLNSFYATLKFVSYFLFFVIVSKAFVYDKNLPMYIFNLIVAYAVVFLLLQLLYGLDFSIYGQLNEASLKNSRYTSFSQDPQKMATIAYTLAIVYLGNMYSKTDSFDLKNTVLFFFLLWIALLTGARSSLVGFTIAAAVLFIYNFSLRSLLVVSFVLSMVYFFLLDYLLTQTVFQRIVDFQDDLEGRSSLFWVEALKIFYDNYIIGIGNGNFSEFMNSTTAYKISYAKGVTADQPESGYLLWMVETGTIGLVTFVIFIIKIVTFYNKNTSKKILKYKLAFLVWVIGFISVYSLTDTKIVYILVLLVTLIFNTKPNKFKKKTNSSKQKTVVHLTSNFDRQNLKIGFKN